MACSPLPEPAAADGDNMTGRRRRPRRRRIRGSAGAAAAAAIVASSGPFFPGSFSSPSSSFLFGFVSAAGNDENHGGAADGGERRRAGRSGGAPGAATTTREGVFREERTGERRSATTSIARRRRSLSDVGASSSDYSYYDRIRLHPDVVEESRRNGQTGCVRVSLPFDDPIFGNGGHWDEYFLDEGGEHDGHGLLHDDGDGDGGGVGGVGGGGGETNATAASAVDEGSGVAGTESENGTEDGDDGTGNEDDEHSHDRHDFWLRHFTSINPFLLPSTGRPRQSTVDAAGAALLALHHFNRGVSTIVPQIADVSARCPIRFTMDFIDTQLSPIRASRAFLDGVLHREEGEDVGHTHKEVNDGSDETEREIAEIRSRPYPTALIGASRSAVSAPLAILSGLHDMPQVSYASTSTILNNKDQFPLFGRLIPSAVGDASAAVEYMSNLGASYIGVLFVNDSYGSTYAQAIQEIAASKFDMHVDLASFAFDASPDEISAAVRSLASFGLRYFVGVIFDQQYRIVMSAAHSQGIAGEGYFWMFGDAITSVRGFQFDARTERGLIEATHGAAVLTTAFPSTRTGRPEFEAFMEHWAELRDEEGAWRKYFDSKMPETIQRFTKGGQAEEEKDGATEEGETEQTAEQEEGEGGANDDGNGRRNQRRRRQRRRRQQQDGRRPPKERTLQSGVAGENIFDQAAAAAAAAAASSNVSEEAVTGEPSAQAREGGTDSLGEEENAYMSDPSEGGGADEAADPTKDPQSFEDDPTSGTVGTATHEPNDGDEQGGGGDGDGDAQEGEAADDDDPPPPCCDGLLSFSETPGPFALIQYDVVIALAFAACDASYGETPSWALDGDVEAPSLGVDDEGGGESLGGGGRRERTRTRRELHDNEGGSGRYIDDDSANGDDGGSPGTETQAGAHDHDAADERGDPKRFTGRELYESFLRTDFEGLYGRVKIDPRTGSRVYSTVPYSVSNFVARVHPDDAAAAAAAGNGDGTVTFDLITTDLYEEGGSEGGEDDFEDGGGDNCEAGKNRTDEGARHNKTKSGVGKEGAKRNEWRSIERFTFSGLDYDSYGPSGRSPQPLVLPPSNATVEVISPAARIFGWVLCGISTLLSVGFGVWTFLNRNNEIVRASQPIFLGMLCLGALLIGCTIVPMSVQKPLTQSGLDAACIATPWLFSFGFIVAFSALFSKTMRVNQIFRSRSGHNRVAVKARDVMKPFIFLFVANLTVLISWTVISPLSYNFTQKGSVDNFDRPRHFYATCSPANPGWDDLLFVLLWGAINISALLYANFQAYQGRCILTEYSESQYIGISMAILLQSFVIGVPVMVVVDDSPTARFVLRTCLVFVTVVAVLLPIFLPKMIFLRQWRAHEKRMERKMLLNMKKQRQMDALAIGDGSLTSWYARQMMGESSNRLSGYSRSSRERADPHHHHSDQNVGLKIIAKYGSSQHSSGRRLFNDVS